MQSWQWAVTIKNDHKETLDSQRIVLLFFSELDGSFSRTSLNFISGFNLCGRTGKECAHL